jgi:hypothetical protein
MFRAIKFRAKILGSYEWVYGCYHFSKDYKFHYISNREKYLERGNEMILHCKEINLVDERTVGQFTGLSDRNNNDIYEGDIMEIRNGRIVKVIFWEGMFKMILLNSSLGFSVSLISENKESAVISNVHDKKWEKTKYCSCKLQL